MIHYNTDKKLSELYLARSEGKTIEALDSVGNWHSVSCEVLHHTNRIKAQTVEEAAEARVGKCASSNGHKERVIDFIAGSNWRGEQDNE